MSTNTKPHLVVKFWDVPEVEAAVGVIVEQSGIERGDWGWSASNGVGIKSIHCPDWLNDTLRVRGTSESLDNTPFSVPFKDMPRLLAALEELNTGKIEPAKYEPHDEPFTVGEK